MERGNQEPTPQLSLEQALWRIHEDQMLQFTATGFRLFEYVETGETQVRSMKAGESEYVFRVPVKEPVIQKDVATLAELFDPNEEGYHYDDGHIADVIDADEFKTWVESLVSPEDVKEAAVKELEKREVEGDEETVPCGNCKGKAHFENDCSCTHGGTTFVDMTEESEDSTVKLREDGVPDPDCGTCEGSGKTQNDCPYCEGCGMAAKYPHIILKNEVTGEERVLKLDLATLIVNGEVEVEWGGYEKLYPNDYQVGEKIIRFNVSAWIDRNIAEMGIDKENAARTSGDSIGKIESERANVAGRRAYWRKHEGEIKTGFNHGQDDMSADDVLSDGQRNLSHSYAWPYGKIKDDNGVVVAEEWVIRPLRPIEDALEDIKTAMAEYGYSLGFTQSFIATGETGPSFFLLDKDGNAVQQLSNDYYIRESLENAWLTFQKMKEHITGSDDS